jgi:hypothetical protein
MGPHYERWVKIYDGGNLKKEYENNIVFSKNDLTILSKYEIITQDIYVRDRVRSLAG